MKSAKERFAQDYQLALIVLVACTATIFVTPFAVYRLLEGTYIVAVTDFLIVFLCLGAAGYAWKTGDTRTPGLVIALVLTLGAAVVASVVKLDGAFWLYPVVMFIFYLTKPAIALVLSAGVLAAIVIQELSNPGSFFSAPNQMASFLASATTAAIFSYVFALRSTRQREQLVRWATRDALTGLSNRRSMEEELEIALATRDRYGAQYGLLILDLDNFKMINDEAGHAAGDQILRDLAELIRTHTRAGDRPFRYGGDEFVIILPNTDEEGLRTIAINLVSAISRNLRWGDIQVTTSLGGALLTPEDGMESWNKRADRCLYEAKERGRNQAVVDLGAGPEA
ncbi:MAG: GGDEF domain-containing protein [Spirochaetaceae bacterium]|nr:MAG: GGDEF domain-containing protein [Spirochaetaceae bacterium]